MKILAHHIAEELLTENHCAIYGEELNRVWPRNGENRQASVEQFAKEHGWRVRHYKDGFVAIFDKEPPSEQN